MSWVKFELILHDPVPVTPTMQPDDVVLTGRMNEHLVRVIIKLHNKIHPMLGSGFHVDVGWQIDRAAFGCFVLENLRFNAQKTSSCKLSFGAKNMDLKGFVAARGSSIASKKT